MHRKTDRPCISKYEILIVVIALCIQSCAHQEPPSGGPVDVTTPEIISTYPENNTRNFSDNKIRLEFDRYVDERSLEESIFISPYIKIEELDWSGTEVEITFTEDLRRNTTYVVNIGTDVKDRFRNQMRMAKSYTLAFSTGPDIDRGGIEGFIFPMKNGDQAAGVVIFAYRLDEVDPDTLNPMTAKPDFITQTGAGGVFSLEHIPYGSYRIFAMRDEYRNLVYDQEADEYGVSSSVIKISPEDTLSRDVLMKMAKEDTTGPRLIKVTARDRNHVVAEFSESLHPSSVNLSSFSIIDTLDRKPLELKAFFPSASMRTSYVAVAKEQDSTRAYYFYAQNVTDSLGNKINPFANSMIFDGSAKADTLDPQLVSVSIKDSVQNIELQPVFLLTFSDALDKTISLDSVSILDESNRQIPVNKTWISNIQFSLAPVEELRTRTWYTLYAELYHLRDWAGRPCLDSVKMWCFETLDPENMGSVEGMIIDGNKLDTVGRLCAVAIQIGEKASKRYITVADAAGKIFFPLVVEGRYTFQAFRDRNDNGLYDAGKPFPFVFSERLSRFSDTLKVRARWPLEGLKIELK